MIVTPSLEAELTISGNKVRGTKLQYLFGDVESRTEKLMFYGLSLGKIGEEYPELLSYIKASQDRLLETMQQEFKNLVEVHPIMKSAIKDIINAGSSITPDRPAATTPPWLANSFVALWFK